MLETIDFIGFRGIRLWSSLLDPVHRLHRLESARKGFVGVPQSAFWTAAKRTQDGDTGRGGTTIAKCTITELNRMKKVQSIKTKTGDRTKAR
jgi:hypothetical protein